MFDVGLGQYRSINGVDIRVQEGMFVDLKGDLVKSEGIVHDSCKSHSLQFHFKLDCD